MVGVGDRFGDFTITAELPVPVERHDRLFIVECTTCHRSRTVDRSTVNILGRCTCASWAIAAYRRLDLKTRAYLTPCASCGSREDLEWGEFTGIVQCFNPICHFARCLERRQRRPLRAVG